MRAIGHQVGDLLGITSKSQQVVGQLEMPEVLGQIPWRQDIKSQRVVDQVGITSIQILNLSQRYFILQ